MVDNALVSVVVPVFNVEQYLHRCMGSLIAQSYQPLEIILVDDGSTDRSGEICDQYAAEDSRVRVIHQANAGVSEARNVGIEAARGGWLTFVDPDDWVASHLISHLVMIADDTDADLAVCRFIRVADVDAVSGRGSGAVQSLSVEEALTMYAGPTTSWMTSPCAKLFRAEQFEDARFPVGRRYEDEFTTYRLVAAARRIALSQAELYYYFIRPGSATQGEQDARQLLDRVDALREQADFFAARGMGQVGGDALRRAFLILRQLRGRVVAAGDEALQNEVHQYIKAVAVALQFSGQPKSVKMLARSYSFWPQPLDVAISVSQTIRGRRRHRRRDSDGRGSQSPGANEGSDTFDGVTAYQAESSTRSPTRSGRRFSVVIPTMQKSKHLEPLVAMYCAHELVGEVIVINNVLTPLSFDHPKVKLLQQDQNIFVNPAWNLGAAEAREELLVISNDDIWFSPQVLNIVERVLRWPVGIVGPSWQTINGRANGRPWFVPAYRLPHGFGTLMFLRSADYVPIPDDLLILGGDDWLFEHQSHRNLQFLGARVGTQWSLTSARPEFDVTKQRDSELFRAKYHTDAYSHRFRREVLVLDSAKRLYRSLLSPLTRQRSGGQRGQQRPIMDGASVSNEPRGLDVIVVAYGSPDKLRSALEPVRELPVTVVDNSSMPAIRDLCAELGCRYLDPGHNGGFAAGVNVGLANRQVPSGDVLLLNPDAVISAPAISELQAALLADDRLASVGPRQVDESGEPVRVTWPFPSPLGIWLDAIALSRLRSPSQYVSGAILLLRAEAIEQVGQFDESFFLYAEEADWQYRASRLGWAHSVISTVTAMHEGAGTSSNEAKRLAHFHGSNERFLRKHYGTMGWQCARVGQVFGDMSRALVRRGETRARLLERAKLYLRGPLRVEAPYRGVARRGGKKRAV